MAFVQAVKTQRKLRLTLCGPSGSGKTYTALKLASLLKSKSGEIGLIDSENNSASLYGNDFKFLKNSLTNFHPNAYIAAIQEAELEGFEFLIIDSLSHVWWALCDMAGSEFGNWSKVKPIERQLMQIMLNCNCHLIATMRSKTEWRFEEYTNKAGKLCTRPIKVGTSPVQSAGIDYEFDIFGQMSAGNVLNITKTRCSVLNDTTHVAPGRDLANLIKLWYEDGVIEEETAESKALRILCARQRIGLSKDCVTNIMKTEFHCNHPRFLTTEQCNVLIAMIDALAEHSEDDNTSTIPSESELSIVRSSLQAS